MLRLWARRTDIRIWHLMTNEMTRSACGNALPHLWANPYEHWEQLRQDAPPTEGYVCRGCLSLVSGDERRQHRRKRWGMAS